MYEAMRCCYQALYFDKDHLKSHFRLARCLHELNWHNEASECLHMFCERYPDYATSSTCESLVSDIEKTLIKLKKADETRKHKANQRATKRNGIQTEADSGARASSECFDKENFLQTNYVDYAKRFVGHCNVATDIKEATFIGTQYVGAGSDDGSFYIWGRCSIFSYYQRSSFFYSSIHLCIPIKYRQTHNESRKNIESWHVNCKLRATEQVLVYDSNFRHRFGNTFMVTCLYLILTEFLIFIICKKKTFSIC